MPMILHDSLDLIDDLLLLQLQKNEQVKKKAEDLKGKLPCFFIVKEYDFFQTLTFYFVQLLQICHENIL